MPSTSAIQLNFTLRTSPNCQTVHLLGSWDSYSSPLPLSRDHSSSKSGSWKGTFRFQGATLTPGQRYWYYYIMDGHHVSHDPAKPSVVEPQTGRSLNTLDVPKDVASKLRLDTKTASEKASRRKSKDIATGRSLSPSKIASPRPNRPHATKKIRDNEVIDALARQLAAAEITQQSAWSSSSEDDGETSSDASDSEIEDDSDASDDSLPSLSSGSRSPASSVSSGSSCFSRCSCERYGITRSGSRVRLDCGGARCRSRGASPSSAYDSGSSCAGSGSSGEDSDADARMMQHMKSKRGNARRHGVVIRSR